MKASIQALGHVLYAPSQYVIPVFQRNYRWEQPQWERFWANIEEVQKPSKSGNHFMGFLVFVLGGTAQPGQNTRFHLIDGQQRLTTTSLLLAAIRNTARRLGFSELAQEIHDYYLVHPLKKGENRYRLLPKEQDGASFLAIVENKPAPVGRMADALFWFETQLASLSTTEESPLRRTFDTICQRLEFMCATLESENAYSIFKSLNSTGVPLGPADLIRNFVFMHVEPDGQDDFDKEYWTPLESRFFGSAGRLDDIRFSRFFRDVLMSEGQYVQPTDTFASFEARHEATGFEPRRLAERLTRQASIHSVIVGNAPDVSPSVTDALADLNKLESATAVPLLLSLFQQRDAGVINSEGLAKAIQMLRGFIMRRFITGESSRGYGQMFVRAIDTTAERPIDALEQYLLERGWPHDARFIEAFGLLPLYKRGYAHEVLEALERARGHKEQADLATTQIEHVMPQTLSDAWAEDLGDEPERVHAEWLHRPGNLTLSAYNQEVGNQPFATKRSRFAESNVVLTREIAKAEVWTEKEILERGLRLAEQASAIWVGPKDAQVDEQLASEVQETRATRLAFWTGLTKYLAHAHPELPTLIDPVEKRRTRLKSGVPHVSLEARYKVQEDSVAVDVYFHGPARKCWVRISAEPEYANSLVGEPWAFDQSSSYAWMTLERSAPSSEPKYWTGLHGWLGQKFAQLYSLLLPYLREEIGPAEKTLASDGGADEVPKWSATKLQQQRFWGELARIMRQRSSTLRPKKPLPQQWTTYSIGRSGIVIAPTLNSRDSRLGVELTISSAKAKEHYHALLVQRDAVDKEFGEQLDWQELPDKHMSRIAIWKDGSDTRDESRWPEYLEWMTGAVLRMETIFRERVRALE